MEADYHDLLRENATLQAEVEGLRKAARGSQGDIDDFLVALDGGYFGDDPTLRTSEFVVALRHHRRARHVRTALAQPEKPHTTVHSYLDSDVAVVVRSPAPPEKGEGGEPT